MPGWRSSKPARTPLNVRVRCSNRIHLWQFHPKCITLKYRFQMQEFIMAASRMVQARVPGDIQDAASQVIRASGLTVSDVVRVLMTRIAQDKEIPAALFQPNAETLAAFSEVKRGGLERFSSVDALFADLHAYD